MRSQSEQYFAKYTAKSQKFLLVTNIYIFQLPNIISNICYILSTSGSHHIILNDVPTSTAHRQAPDWQHNRHCQLNLGLKKCNQRARKNEGEFRLEFRNKELTLQKAQRLLYAPSGLKFKYSTFGPQSAFMCFVWLSEQTEIISLHIINWLVFTIDGVCLPRSTT